MIIVFNTSPLIFLSRLEMLEIFLSQAEEYYIPQAVLYEILAKDDDVKQTLSTFFNKETICTRTVQMAVLAESLRQRLGQGESEAITLALELKADAILPASRVGFRCAQRQPTAELLSVNQLFNLAIALPKTLQRYNYCCSA